MLDDEQGKQLHERQSCGETLTPAEYAQLIAWYATQDMAESNLLRQKAVEADLGTLQQQVDSVSAQLLAVTQRIQQVTAENSALRQEIARLRQQLARQKQPA